MASNRYNRQDKIKTHIDPTENVILLMAMTNRRQDDLREAEARRLDDLRASERIRLDELRHTQYDRIRELADIRADFAERLSAAEAKRIDAIRAVDVNAVAVASQRASDQATVLANQVAQSAEALRTLVASTAAAVATSQAQLAASLTTRLTTLEQGSYQQQGKTSRDDPMMATLLSEVQSLRQSRDDTGGRRMGSNESWKMMTAIVSLIATLLVVGTFVFASRATAPVYVQGSQSGKLIP